MDSKALLVQIPAISYCTAAPIGAVRNVMMVRVHRAEGAEFISASAERLSKTASAVKEFSDVTYRAISPSFVGNMSALKGVMQGNVGIVHFRGKGLAPVGRKRMKECHVTSPCPYAEELVISF